jgi:thiol-disulfide isomerase/thioredoxin
MHLALLFFVSLVNDVRALVERHDFAAAERAAHAYQTKVGANAEYAAALSWMARGALADKQLDRADRYAAESRKLSLEIVRTRRLDADPWLPTALGASIEVHAQILAARGERSEAVASLREDLGTFGATSIGERIRKNLNLLSLEGKPAPPLEVSEWVGSVKPAPLAALRGHPVLLFFWAHWCGDCKSMSAILASLMKTYGPKGLVLIAPTKLFGYVAGGQDAPPAVEKPYIERIRQQYYPALSGVPVPLSAANYLAYGSSTTPTIVLVDRDGVVRMYHPGVASEAELSGRIQKLIGK